MGVLPYAEGGVLPRGSSITDPGSPHLLGALDVDAGLSHVEFHKYTIVLNRLVQFNVIRRYVKTNSVYTTHRLNALAAPPGIRV